MRRIEKRDFMSIGVGEWIPHDWAFGEKPLDCHSVKVGRGRIILHLREQLRMNDARELVPTGVFLWNFTCSFGANSDDSYSGLIPEPCSLDAAKLHIESHVITKVGS